MSLHEQCILPSYSDYRGAESTGMNALLLRRPAGEHENENIDEDLRAVNVIDTLDKVLSWVGRR